MNDFLKSVEKEKEEFEGEETLGFENREDDDDKVYPDAEVNISREHFSVFQLKRRYEQSPPGLKLDPDFQRELVWNEKQKSELIESILMGIPLPLIYVKEDQSGLYIIVDGRQRLTAFFDFMNDEFELGKLKILKKINKKKFSQLNRKEQNKIEECQLILHIIKHPTKDRITFDLFDRVNRGGTRLNNQEMRNALYQGNSTELLKELSGSDGFKKVTEWSINTNRMKDRYLILRFIAFYLWKKELLVDIDTGEKVEYRSDLEDFLGKAMQFLNNKEQNDIINKLPIFFENTMEDCLRVFGEGCFRLPKKKEDKQRRPINMALFETISYFTARSREMGLIQEIGINNLKIKYKELMKNERYIEALTHMVDSNISVTTRFDIIEKKLEEISDA